MQKQQKKGASTEELYIKPKYFKPQANNCGKSIQTQKPNAWNEPGRRVKQMKISQTPFS